MTLGLGIFLSSLFLGTVALYLATKDRWRWRRIVLWVVGCTVGACLAVAGFFYYQSLPKVQTSFWDIPLGATKEDVLFIKGEPNQKNEEAKTWAFEKSKCLYVVAFDKNRVKAVVAADIASDASYSCLLLQGIGMGNGSNRVKRVFGEPTEVIESEDGLQRIFRYQKYKVGVTLRQNKVVNYMVYEPMSSNKP